MYFNTDVVVLRIGLGDGGRGFSHPETDLQDTRRTTAEHRIEIERSGGIGDTDAGHHFLVVTLLRVRYPALAQHEAADMPCPPGGINVFLFFAQDNLAHEPIRPEVGDEGSAE